MTVDVKPFEMVLSVLRQDKQRLITQQCRRIEGWCGSKMSPNWIQTAVFTMGFSLLSTPVVAQSGEGIAETIICGSNLGTGLSGLFTIITIVLILTGIFRGANGFRKMSDPRPQQKQEGREELKGCGVALGGALALGVAPDLLNALGLSVFDCVNFAGI